MSRMRARTVLPGLALASVAAVLVALAAGSGPVGLSDVIDALSGDGDPLSRRLILELRWPRAMSAFAVGAALGVAGALMQVLLRNPLADPYVLGVSGGAAVMALVAMTLGFGVASVQTAALVGALAVMLAVFQLARSPRGFTPTRLLLTGVVIAAGLNALISLILALGPDSSLRSMLFWLMGDFSFAGDAWWPLVAVAIVTALAVALARPLDLLAHGEDQAAVLGLSVRPVRSVVYVVASLLTAVAVTHAGSIGFVGLVVPHAIRLVAGPGHRVLLPASALAGGSLLVLADTAARTVAAPRQLPVGALTALLGVPLFIALMRRQ